MAKFSSQGLPPLHPGLSPWAARTPKLSGLLNRSHYFAEAITLLCVCVNLVVEKKAFLGVFLSHQSLACLSHLEVTNCVMCV